jgi:hypothetical protein
MPTSPLTILRQYLRLGVHSLVVLATDGGANDGKGVEITGTSDGSINVNLTGGAIGGQTVAQGNSNGDPAEAWLVTLPDLSPPVGGTITGDDAAHAFDALTGPGILIVAATGGTARIGAAADVSSTIGFPVIDGASYDAGMRRYAAIEANKVYVPVGCTVVWGAHQ